MRFRSTRGTGRRAPTVPFTEAMEHGLAPDGGLYVPERFVALDPADIGDEAELVAVATRVLAPLFAGDRLEPHLDEICAAALSFPIPLVALRDRGDGTPAGAVLELYHGPTAAFKDVGARFLAECFARADARDAGGRPRTILVATSGDTGGAVAAAFHGRPGFEVGVLFPADGVSDRQRHQLTCWGDNVRAFAVRGSFDDCQGLLKAALADPRLREARRLTTANSINIARLLPQVVYYAWAALRYRSALAPGVPPSVAPAFLVPSGNVGNATAALWARRLGLPVGRVVLVANENRAVPEFFATGRVESRPTVKTLANAMDVGAPSNLERIVDLYPRIEELRGHAGSVAVDDATIERTIRTGVARWGRVWDPHTATAASLLDASAAALGVEHPIVVATAHPAKFEQIVEPLIGAPVDVPPTLAGLLSRPTTCTEIAPDLGELTRAMG